MGSKSNFHAKFKHNLIFMKNLTFLLTAVLAISSLSGCKKSSGSYAANDSAITYMGRTVEVDSTGYVRFNYPGVTAMLNFTGPKLEMTTNPGSGYWMVEVDSLPAVKMQLTDKDSVLTIASGLEDGPHSARITYCIEGYEFNPEIRGFQLAEGEKLLDAPQKGKLKIEFIGNSITCGYGTEAPDADTHFSYDTENHTLGYAYLTARALDADFNMVCRSGIGIYRNFDGKKEGDTTGTMPLEYDNAMLYVKDIPWDFSRFTPDIVCVNLGTNDTSTGNYDIKLFREKYEAFADHLREVYPDAKIVLLSGCMLNGKELELVKQQLDSVALGRENFFRFDMTPQDGSLGYGADYHPSSAQAKRMAEELTPFLRSL